MKQIKKDNIVDSVKISQIAQDLAIISGINSLQARIDLIKAISTRNIIPLKKYGIVKINKGMI